MMHSRVGSFAASQTYADLAITLREIDLRWVEGYLNRYFIKPLVGMNFPTPKGVTAKAKIRPEVRQATLEKIILKMFEVKVGEPGEILAAMVDIRDTLLSLGVPIRSAA